MKHIKFYTIIAALFCMVSVNAQIGYQVSLLNSATGEPRANETVGVTLEITNSEGTVVCQESTSATTNEFGVLSLQVGSSNTFANMDWSKLPLYISATVDGVMVGRSQILTVPVAEVAKALVNVDLELICKTWEDVKSSDGYIRGARITLTQNKTFSYYFYYENDDHSYSWRNFGSGTFLRQGNLILLCLTSGTGLYLPTCLVYNNGKLYGGFGVSGSFELQ